MATEQKCSSYNKKRRALLVYSALFAVLGGIGFLFYEYSKQRITRNNYSRIQRGMTRAQVEEILGKPQKPSSQVAALYPQNGLRGSPDGAYLVEWFSRGGKIEVYFDREDRVRSAAYERPRTRDFFDKVRDWFNYYLQTG